MSRVHTERRNLLIIAFMVAVLALLSVLAVRQGTLNIMPPEPAEIGYKRRSPDNAFYRFRSARDRLREVGVLPDPVEPAEGRRRSAREPARILWPATQPEQFALLEKCDYAISVARKAFWHPYYLCPDVGTVWTWTGEHMDFRPIAAVTAMRGLLRSHTQGADEEAFAYALDAVRMGRMVASDGPVYCYEMGSDMQWAGLRCLAEMAGLAASREVLEETLDALTELTARPVPIVP
ncbi:MAG TPA: hypothetical protein ENN80_06045, partial [Candidatus Hydrogenedentes bacterium]|nr:hypothetical protein [Candidatus Hydrogenedentota bacterium]